MIEKRLIVTDLHGCFWKRNEGPQFYTKQGLTAEQVDGLSRPLEEIKPWKVMTPLASHKLQIPGEGWMPLVETLRFDPENVTEIRDHYRQSTPLWQSWYNKVVELSDWERHFKPYQVDNQEREGLFDLSRRDDYVTVCSALPAVERRLFMWRMSWDRVWDNLGGDDCPKAVLRESEGCPPILYKAVTYRVYGEATDILDRKLIGVDDDYHIALCLSYLFNVEVHLPMSEEEAKKQPEWPVPDNLRRHSLNGLLVFNSGLYQIASSGKQKQAELTTP